MQSRFDEILASILPERPVLLAVSGGVDSMVMADLFLGSPLSGRFEVAHCNFHLRGEESDSDEAFVRDWCGANGVGFIKKDFRTREYSLSRGVSLEMAARELRYSWFEEVCRKRGFGAVAVAHNSLDNAETLMLNLLRGTGLKGACGMKQVSSLNGSDDLFLLRPLLGFSRDEIREYAVSRGLKWHEDSTNKDTAFKRNLLRNNVFPLFARINPSFVRTLAQDMERFSQVQSLADDFVAEETPRVLKGKYRLDLGALLGNRHWKYLLFRIMESYGFAPQTIRELTSCLEAGDSAGGKRFISGDLVAVTSASEIVIARLAASHGSLTVDGPGEYSLDGTVFSVREVTASALKQKTGTTLMAIGFPFTVRHWQDGDWMQPLGMRGCRKKLSDMFTDLKFSLPDKERALVVADEGSHVLSLLGYRIDESVKAEQGRKCILVDITG